MSPAGIISNSTHCRLGDMVDGRNCPYKHLLVVWRVSDKATVWLGGSSFMQKCDCMYWRLHGQAHVWLSHQAPHATSTAAGPQQRCVVLYCSSMLSMVGPEARHPAALHIAALLLVELMWAWALQDLSMCLRWSAQQVAQDALDVRRLREGKPGPCGRPLGRAGLLSSMWRMLLERAL